MKSQIEGVYMEPTFLHMVYIAYMDNFLISNFLLPF